MKDLLNCIMYDEELTIEEKELFIEKIIMASHGINKFISDGFYFHTEVIDNNIDIQLWYRNIDEKGTLYHGNTNYNCYEIVNIMKQYFIESKSIVKTK